MKSYLKDWQFMRLLRLVAGVLVVIQGVLTKQWLIATVGLLFSGLSLLNIGCCGASGCKIPANNSSKNKEE